MTLIVRLVTSVMRTGVSLLYLAQVSDVHIEIDTTLHFLWCQVGMVTCVTTAVTVMFTMVSAVD